ncbi:MAG: hypothetical protein FJ255_09900 [Phycisphaerae bacterium]|nr:hypothetical protein [Phycisphaerae bacterium]
MRATLPLALTLLAASCAAPATDGRGEGLAVLVLRLTSELNRATVERTMEERAPGFRDLPGLVQKIYGVDPVSGDYCGVLVFRSRADLEAYRVSELARSNPAAYRVVNSRAETYDLLFTLHPGLKAGGR